MSVGKVLNYLVKPKIPLIQINGTIHARTYVPSEKYSGD